ncbi:phage holin family protein [Lysinibacillus sphaericus]|uniref:Holin n=3 Tax=Lysinibacillus TaxID=400634 RepID=B1HTL8_LYSSC|nr:MULTISPECIES: phage holin family protein [Lysinibacillus]MBE5082989.1 phage holin family protein [Bacillus thuringiensis]ACA41222.1 holin [Lysinibacillus sphaericus C3-41]AMO32864.1 holin [Lysinibacillus sphaericus]AMR92032.1 holin [Lysinibacillus sphaericus]ANA46080.1 holin [Lysinibacillus sphaericus]
MDITQIIQHPILVLVPKPIYYMFAAYFLFKMLDFTTGLLKTWKGVVNYKSAIMRDGIIRWISELVAIVFVFALDMMFGLEFYLTGFTLALFLYKEGGSIAENLQMLGVDMPGIVDETIEKFNKKEGDRK